MLRPGRLHGGGEKVVSRWRVLTYPDDNVAALGRVLEPRTGHQSATVDGRLVHCHKHVGAGNRRRPKHVEQLFVRRHGPETITMSIFPFLVVKCVRCHFKIFVEGLNKD